MYKGASLINVTTHVLHYIHSLHCPMFTTYQCILLDQLLTKKLMNWRKLSSISLTWILLMPNENIIKNLWQDQRLWWNHKWHAWIKECAFGLLPSCRHCHIQQMIVHCHSLLMLVSWTSSCQLYTPRFRRRTQVSLPRNQALLLTHHPPALSQSNSFIHSSIIT